MTGKSSDNQRAEQSNSSYADNSGEPKSTIKIESHYVKQPDGFVYYYWRIVGLGDWNVQKTAMKEVPTVEMVMERRNYALNKHARGSDLVDEGHKP